MSLPKSLLFTIVFIAMLAILDYLLVFLFGQTTNLLIKFFSLRWYWIVIFGLAVITFVVRFWTYLSLLLTFAVDRICKISFPSFCYIVVTGITTLNVIWLNYNVWSSLLSQSHNIKFILVGLLFTYLSLQISFGLYYGARLNYKENHNRLSYE